MSPADTDPVENARGRRDLYEISTWEPRSMLDAFSVRVYWAALRTGQAIVIFLALGILLAIGGASALWDPVIGLLTLLSIIPTLVLAGYVWYVDVTTNEPVSLLAATFVLAVLTAGFAAILNGLFQPAFAALGMIGMVLFFYVIVGPVEETVKLLAIRLYAYNDDRFDAVIDGAVYGAVAGLGFATIENAVYIAQVVGQTDGVGLGLDLIGMGGGITATRALAGPGHVIFSSFAGYYLGLAKFNPENRGPIIVKGLIIAAVIHATYNTTVGVGSGLIRAFTGVPELVSFVLYIACYVSVFGYLLYRKLDRYRTAYNATVTESA